MLEQPARPEGCCIEEIEDFDVRVYRWRQPSGGFYRYIVSTFLLVWLCGWATGWVTVFRLVLTTNNSTGRIFLTCWLCLWTIAGVFAARWFKQLWWPGSPEVVTLGANTFQYQPGRITMAAMTDPSVLALNPKYFAARLQEILFSPAATKRGSPFRNVRKAISLPKSELGLFVLERIDERQRLYFHHGDDRIEIGLFLREDEREWLAAVLEAWRNS